MFFKFDDEDATRLNRGVRGRLVEHCKFLLREKRLKGYDAHDIYQNTKELTFEQSRVDDSVVDMRESSSESEQEGAEGYGRVIPGQENSLSESEEEPASQPEAQSQAQDISADAEQKGTAEVEDLIDSEEEDMPEEE